MKKTLLSVVLCVALLVSAMSTMLAMPASAASGVDFLVSGTAAGNDATPESTYSVTDGKLVFNATAAAQEVALTIEDEANLNNYPFFEAVISSNVDFDIAIFDKNNNKWMFGAGDFCFHFGEGLSAGNPLPAGDYDVKFSLTGAYTWTGDPLPANAAVKSITFIAKAPGTITVSKCQVTDGMVDINMDSRGDTSGVEFDAPINLIAGDYTDSPAPSADDPQSSVKVTKNGDQVIYGNTNGQWPAASYTFAEPIVAKKGAAIDVDFTVKPGCKTTIYVFMGPTTPSDFGAGSYVYLANFDDILAAELSGGNYKGVLFLDDIVEKTIADLEAVDKCYDANGNYVITGVKIFAISDSATDEAVVVNKLNLLTVKDESKIPSTTKKEDRTTTTQGGLQTTTTAAGATTTTVAGATTTTVAGGTTGAQGATTTVAGATTTTVAQGGSTGGDSTPTGDVTQATLFAVIALAAAAVVTLSVVSKKAKSR